VLQALIEKRRNDCRKVYPGIKCYEVVNIYAMLFSFLKDFQTLFCWNTLGSILSQHSSMLTVF